MVITMAELVNFYQKNAIFSNKVLPLKGAFKINRIKKDIEKDYAFYQEKFKEILEEYAERDDAGNIQFSEDGEQIMIKEGMIGDCSDRLEELNSIEIEIDNYDFNIEELGDIDCTPEELEILMPFLS